MIRTLSAVMMLALAALAGLLPVTSPAGEAVAASAPASTMMFIANTGQFDPAARFQVWGGQQVMWLAEDAIWVTAVQRAHDGTLSAAAVKLSFAGANPRPALEPFGRLETHVSYFIGDDAARWRSDVPAWRGVRYVDLYPGVTLELSGEGRELAWRLAARPGADLAAVRLRVEGADDASVQDGRIMLRTAGGVVSLAPKTGSALPLEVAATGGKIEAFVVPASSPASGMDRAAGPALAAAPADDPASLIYSTYLGPGGGDEMCDAIAVDSAGRAHITGNTTSPSFPVTPGAFDTTYTVGQEAFVARFNAAGTVLEYATFLGGSDWEYATPRCAIAIDQTGRTYVAGQTDSSDFPTTASAYDRTFNGRFLGGDAFVARLNATGTALEYATYLGGSRDEDIAALALDDLGRVYVAGATSSTDFPTSQAVDSSFNGDWDGFAARLSAAGDALEYATFLGGKGRDDAMGIGVDSNYRTHVVGSTASSDFPTTTAALDRTLGGASDAYLVRLSASGSVREYSSFLGGQGSERRPALALDRAGKATIALSTQSADMPTSPAAADTTLGGDYDCYVARLSAAGNALEYGTYLGGSGIECYDYTAIAVDRNGRAAVAGNVLSDSAADFPITDNGFDTSYNEGWDDAFVALLDESGSRLENATFLGGEDDEGSRSIVLDSAGNVYVTGDTFSKDFPTSTGAFDTTTGWPDTRDHFVTKLSVALPPTVLAQRAANGPAVNGDLSEWAWMGTKYLDRDTASSVTGAETAPSPADLSAHLRAAWAPDRVYFGVTIQDNVLVGAVGARLQDSDSIEFGIHVPAKSESHQFIVALDGRQSHSVNGTPTVSSMTVATRTVPGGWTLEGAIPATALGLTALAAGQQYPFTFGLWDNDRFAAPGQTHMLWMSSAADAVKPDWGRLALDATTYNFSRPIPTATRTPSPTVTRTPTATASATPSPTTSRTPAASGTPTRTPTTTVRPKGLKVQGYVHRDSANGPGLPGVTVRIYLANYSSPAATVLTNASGYYETPFIAIPGDEMITNRATLAGYRFTPPHYAWRHYSGLEEIQQDFIATAESGQTPIPAAHSVWLPLIVR